MVAILLNFPMCNTETLLQVMFEDFGPVYQINVLRDKISGQSKGRNRTSGGGDNMMIHVMSHSG